MTLLSIFGLGLWPIFVLLLAGAGVFGYQAYKAHNSNSTTQVGYGADAHVVDNTGNVPYSKIPQAYASAGLVVLAILFLIFGGK